MTVEDMFMCSKNTILYSFNLGKLNMSDFGAQYISPSISTWENLSYKNRGKKNQSSDLSGKLNAMNPLANLRLVGGFNPSEKYESISMMTFPINGEKKHVPNHQPEKNPIKSH